MAHNDTLERIDGGWSLPIGTGWLTVVELPNSTVVRIESILDITIDAPISSTARGIRSELPVGSVVSAGSAVWSLTVATILVHDSGRLSIDFSDGTALAVEPTPLYEAFQVNEITPDGPEDAPATTRWDDTHRAKMVGPRSTGFVLVSNPGGGLTTWTLPA